MYKLSYTDRLSMFIYIYTYSIYSYIIYKTCKYRFHGTPYVCFGSGTGVLYIYIYIYILVYTCIHVNAYTHVMDISYVYNIYVYLHTHIYVYIFISRSHGTPYVCFGSGTGIFQLNSQNKICKY
jgi:hypothetical protein